MLLEGLVDRLENPSSPDASRRETLEGVETLVGVKTNQKLFAVLLHFKFHVDVKPGHM